MNNSVSTCLQGFTTTLYQEGDVLQEEVKEHFTSLESFLSNQSKEVSEVSEENGLFAQRCGENVVHSTGRTPEKKARTVLREIRSTFAL
jgi:hypothetical protein